MSRRWKIDLPSVRLVVHMRPRYAMTWAAAAGLFTACCPSAVPSSSPVAPAGVDAGAEFGPCARACARLAELGCPEAAPTVRGTTCTEVCEDAAAEGIDLGTSCVATAASCEAVTRCR